MKKQYFLLFIAAMFCFGSRGWGQVFAHPGATWIYYHPTAWGMCSNYYEISEYTGDTVVLGVSANTIKVTLKQQLMVPPFPWQTYVSNRYFHVSGDTVSMFDQTDSSWVELYNFSLAIGDSTSTPMTSPINAFSQYCPDSLAYQQKAVVTNTGTSNIGGQNLRFYTVKYWTGVDTTHAFHTFYERVISLDYWHADDIYWCGAVVECGYPDLLCYKDNGMMTDSACYDISSIMTLDLEEEISASNIRVYPNPVSDILYIEGPNSIPEKYCILSMDGKLVQASQWQNSIDVSGLSAGIYMITNETRTWYQKFLKQ